MSAVETNTESKNGRDAKGRFCKGNPGGVGNPFARQTAALRQAALDAVTPEDLKEIMLAMKAQALQGNVAAAKLLLSYTIGKTTKAENPDTLNRQELDTIIANHNFSLEHITQILQGTPLELVLTLLRTVLPTLLASKSAMMKQMADEALAESKEEKRIEEPTVAEEVTEDKPLFDPVLVSEILRHFGPAPASTGEPNHATSPSPLGSNGDANHANSPSPLGSNGAKRHRRNKGKRSRRQRKQRA